jgi:hypothetical protein
VLCAVLLLALGEAHASSSSWEGADTALLAGALTGLVVDWSQTRKVTYVSEFTQTSRVTTGARRAVGMPALAERQTGAEVAVSQQRWRPHMEGNRLLGHEPSNAEINRYFITSIGATVGLAFVLPKEWRRAFLGGLIITQTFVVSDNHMRLGLRMNF